MHSADTHELPGSIEEAVDCLIADLSLNAEIQIITAQEDSLLDLHLSFGAYIGNKVGLVEAA